MEENFYESYKVYIKTDENGNITAVNSSAFLTDIEGWTEIDAGVGDKYHHAQNNYFPDTLYSYVEASDDNGSWKKGFVPRYKYINGHVEPRSMEDIANDQSLQAINTRQSVSLDQVNADLQYVAMMLGVDI